MPSIIYKGYKYFNEKPTDEIKVKKPCKGKECRLKCIDRARAVKAMWVHDVYEGDTWTVGIIQLFWMILMHP